MKRAHHRPFLALALLVLAAAAPAFGEDVLVVAPEALEPALAEWKAHREAGGWTVTVRCPGDDVGAVVKAVHGTTGGSLGYVLLLGDVQHVPCVYRPTDAIKQFERDPRIATDAPYADVDDDGVPDLALGRIPADTVEQAKALLGRVIAYETSKDHGPWRRRLNLFAGVGGFGAQADMAIEQLTRVLMAREVPGAVDVNFTYANPSSAFCPPPKQFADVFLERINEGALVMAYVGHGSKRHLDRPWTADGPQPILEPEHLPRVATTGAPSLALFVACSTGSLDGEEDCLAEELLHRPDGPIAVIASSRVSTPYSNAIIAKEMIPPLYGDGPLRAGDLLLAAKRALLTDGAGDPIRTQIETMAAGFFEKDPARRAVDRQEHVLLYHLFGDPTLLLARPEELSVEAEEEAIAGEPVIVNGTSILAGKALVELVRRRESVTRPKADRSAAEDYQRDYDLARLRVVSRVELDVPVGTFTVELPVPKDTPRGRYIVRVYVTGANASAMGDTTTRVFPPR